MKSNTVVSKQDSFESFVKEKTKDSYKQYLDDTQKYADASFNIIEIQKARTTQEWITLFPDKDDSTKLSKKGANRKAEVNWLFKKTREGYIKMKLFYAEKHYQNTVSKLVTRMIAKGFEEEKLECLESRVGVNIESTWKSGEVTIRTFTIVAEGPIQQAHYRFLIH